MFSQHVINNASDSLALKGGLGLAQFIVGIETRPVSRAFLENFLCVFLQTSQTTLNSTNKENAREEGKAVLVQDLNFSSTFHVGSGS